MTLIAWTNHKITTPPRSAGAQQQEATAVKLIVGNDGMPVFLDDAGRPMDYAPALKTLRRRKNWSVRDVAQVCGVSARTVEGWEQGRLPGKPALLLLMPHVS